MNNIQNDKTNDFNIILVKNKTNKSFEYQTFSY